MIINHYYDKAGRRVDDEIAATLLADPAYQRIALTRIDTNQPDHARYIHTTWLGRSHNEMPGRPILFETALVTPNRQTIEIIARYETEHDALRGHHATADLIAATLTGATIVHDAQWPGETRP